MEKMALKVRKQPHKRERSRPLGQASLSFTGLFALLFFFPMMALASVRITEVMYDAPGSDSGHEWIELTNMGTSAIDLRKWKVAEGGSNHGLAIARGNGFIQPGESVVVSNNPSTFMGEWGSFVGTTFKSAFSLSNSGETIELKNASSSIEDSIIYSSTQGGVGSGESLQLHDGSFSPALPTPGVYPGGLVRKPSPIAKASLATKPKSDKASSQAATSTKTSTYTKYVRASTAAVAEAPVTTLTSPMLIWLLGLGGVMVLGVAGALFARFETAPALKRSETNTLADEFDIQ